MQSKKDAKTSKKKTVNRIKKHKTGRVKRIRNIVRKVDANKPLAKAVARNAFEPAAGFRNPDMDTYKMKSQSVEQLPCELQFQLAKLAPDTFTAPFVENGNPLDVPTQKMVANWRRTFSKANSTDVDVYGVVFLNGFAGNYYDGTSGLNTFQSNSDATVYTQAQAITGEAFTTIWGTSPYADRLCIYSVSADVELVAPEAGLSGIVHCGTISVGSLKGGVSINQLVAQADTRYDVKDPAARVIRLRTAIVNRSAIHLLRPTGSTAALEAVNEEFVSYAVYQSPVSSLIPVLAPETPITTFAVNIGLTAQAIWWPDGAQPLMKGLAMSSQKQIRETRTTAMDQENANYLERLSHLWNEPAKLSSIVSALCSKKSLKTLFDFADRYIPGASLVGSVLLDSPAVLTPGPIIDDIAYLTYEMTLEQGRMHFSTWPDEALAVYDLMCATREELISILGQEVIVRNEVASFLQKCQTVIATKHGKRTLKFLDCDGNEVNVDSEYMRLRKFRHNFQGKQDSISERPKSLSSRR